MDFSSDGRGNEVSRSGGGGDLRHLPPEYHFPVYFHSEDTVAMSGGGVTAGGTGVNDMVGEDLIRSREWR